MNITVYEPSIFLRARRGDNNKPHIWFVHGFGASSDSFAEAFTSRHLRGYSLFAPDFPGFGLSPVPKCPHSIKQSAELLKSLIEKFSAAHPVVLVAHSMGGPVATHAALALKQEIISCVSVEGNFTAADCFISGKAARAADPVEWKSEFENRLYALSLKDRSYRRYWSSFRLASPFALRKWALTGVKETGKDLGGRNFLRVPCHKVYIYGEKSLSKQTRHFIEKNDIEAVEFRNCGHFVMDDATELFYKTLAEVIAVANGGSIMRNVK